MESIKPERDLLKKFYNKISNRVTNNYRILKFDEVDQQENPK
jgi:hypothetical protein